MRIKPLGMLQRSIGAKLIATFIVVVLLLISLAWYSIDNSTNTLKETVAKNSIYFANILSNTIDNGIFEQRHDISVIVEQPLVIDNLTESNAFFEGMGDVQGYMNLTNDEWKSTPLNETNPLMEELMNNSVANYLSDQFIVHYIYAHGIDLYNQVLLTNEFGAVVAMTSRPMTYRQDGYLWWQKAVENGVYFSDVNLDNESKRYGMVIAVRIDDGNGSLLGVSYSFLNLISFIHDIEIVGSGYQTAEVRVLTADGRIIYSTQAYQILENVSDREYFKSAVNDSGYFFSTEGDRAKTFSYATSMGHLQYKGYDWIVEISYDQEEVLSPINALSTNIFFVSLALIVFCLIVAFLFSRAVSRPLYLLRDGSIELSKGNLDARVVVKSRDEIGELASAFNIMAARLGEFYEELERKVTERTKDLATANKSLDSEISIRKEKEVELQRLLKELEQSNKELQQFAYVASHDLQEPLRMIASYLQLLSRRYSGKLDKDADEFITYAVDGATRLQNMIDDLLAFSRVGTRGKEYEDVEMKKVVEDVLANLAVAIEDEKANISVGNMPKIKADPSQMMQLLQNLVENAIKFRGKDPPRIEISAKRGKEEWIFSIRDNGIGIDSKYFDRVFVVFQRLHAGEVYKGTGIGLAIAKKIVERHSGHIWIESEAGKGSVFNFTIPDVKKELMENGNN